MSLISVLSVRVRLPLYGPRRRTSQVRRRDIERARRQWDAFAEAAPGYPADMFHGRGIVTLAGRLKYLVPAWVNIQMLRRTGAAQVYSLTHWKLFSEPHTLHLLPQMHSSSLPEVPRPYILPSYYHFFTSYYQVLPPPDATNTQPLLVPPCPVLDSELIIPPPPRAGCTLPVEVFFPADEFPSPGAEVQLARLGVSCRTLHAGGGPQEGYSMKAAALLLSSFEEVITLYPVTITTDPV